MPGRSPPRGWKSPIRFLRTAIGEQLGVIESKGFEGPGPDVSPAWPVMSSQELIEAILLDAVRETGRVDVRFATEATKLVRGASPGDEGTALEVRSRATGATETLTGRALVAADGAASLIRGELGVELEGSKELLHIVNCYFRADIEPHLGDRKGVLFFISNEHANGVLQPLDGAGPLAAPPPPRVLRKGAQGVLTAEQVVTESRRDDGARLVDGAELDTEHILAR